MTGDLGTTQILLDLLDLDGNHQARTDEDIFVGQTPRQNRNRVFGGQVLAQSIMAATRTVDATRSVHSLHGYFLRPGDPNQNITFGVQRLRDGRSFSARRVHAYQNGEPILSMIASFQEPAEGLEHHDPMPFQAPDPESLPTTAELVGHLNHPVAKEWAFERPFDVRHVTEPIYLEGDKNKVADSAVWLRTTSAMPDDLALHRAALAYASDYVLLEPVLRAHGLAWVHQGLSIASLDHAMWWHQDFRVDEWLLYVLHSPSASSARGLGTGQFFNRDGQLVATVAQEGMVRLPEFGKK
ncbi:acyl-CoA thioesterase [Glutamicibacter halophytocola]|uniref:Acyl-CoA thioesterase II n=1 Tax=Glutamicibacter halophytocola TaxID=1933880 RepID=A0ABX5Y6P3_9MICC|nr:acyl-CoA thioesterase II [Glutamicibacter halophytocola]ALG29221.1 acyl-CoA thioesterase [Glutamicibacter halophytocola]MBF6673330.1 acyl-CoA thioesterase II [Glutamicibacter sp. FBE19]NQD39158.1 acyl-CoA thioesterase II [Glutamicibacter halophytocola]QDY65482.1 acyl-CoA thioesterase II [Glutamicibacter halophytocola]